jgi:hypothetical protein
VPHRSPLAWCTNRGQTPRPLIVRQVASSTASAACSLSGRRAPRAPVREGQQQRRPAHTSAVAAPTAQRGIVFAPSTSRRQRSPGTTPWVAGGAKQRVPSFQREIPIATPLRHTTAGPTEAHFPWRSVRVTTPGVRGHAGGGAPGVFGPSTLGLWPWCGADRGARRWRTRMQGMRVMLDPILRQPTGTPSALPRPRTPIGATAP